MASYFSYFKQTDTISTALNTQLLYMKQADGKYILKFCKLDDQLELHISTDTYDIADLLLNLALAINCCPCKFTNNGITLTIEHNSSDDTYMLKMACAKYTVQDNYNGEYMNQFNELYTDICKIFMQKHGLKNVDAVKKGMVNFLHDYLCGESCLNCLIKYMKL